MPSPVLEPETTPAVAGAMIPDAYVVERSSAGVSDDARPAIDAAIRAARAAGLRAAVCVVDLGLLDIRAMHAAVDAVAAMVASRTRRGDRLCRHGRLLVVLASALGHPLEGEHLAERLRIAAGDRAAVGLALFPAHGDAADALLGAARASATRTRDTTDLWPDQMRGAWRARA